MQLEMYVEIAKSHNNKKIHTDRASLNRYHYPRALRNCVNTGAYMHLSYLLLAAIVSQQ